MQTNKKQHEKIVRDVVKKYGYIIDLKKSPFLIIEILRRFGPIFDDPDGGVLPGGVPPPPSPPPPSIVGIEGYGEEKITNTELLREILKLGSQIKAIKLKIG